MVYLQDDDKLLQNGQAQDPSAPASPEPAQPAGAGGGLISGSPAAGSGGGAPSGGKGGFGFTNFQDYLKANQGSTGTADYLKTEVGGAFNQDQSKLAEESGKAKTAAQTEAQKTQIGTDQASQLIQKASTNYQYGTPTNGTQATAYQSAVDPLKQALGAKYQGPSSFAYGLDGKTQEYGQALGNESSYKAIMDQLYNKAGGGQLGKGQLALQRQLDVSNQGLSDTRTQLQNQYKSLQDTTAQTVNETQNAIGEAKDQFQSGQNGLRSYLEGSAQSNRKTIDDTVASERSKHQAVKDYIRERDANQEAVYGRNIDDMITGVEDLNPTETNIYGIGSQRNQYNSLLDALGMNDRAIGRDSSSYYGNRATIDAKYDPYGIAAVEDQNGGEGSFSRRMFSELLGAAKANAQSSGPAWFSSSAQTDAAKRVADLFKDFD